MRCAAPFIFGLLAGLWGAGAAAQAPGGSRFDGHWGVVLACPPSPDGALPFTWRFAAGIRGGVLHGQYGTPGQPPSMSLDGRVEYDGAAQLQARGLAGQSAYNLNQASRGVPFQYDVTAQFDPTRGTGSWVTKRTCDFTFTKQ